MSDNNLSTGERIARAIEEAHGRFRDEAGKARWSFTGPQIQAAIQVFDACAMIAREMPDTPDPTGWVAVDDRLPPRDSRYLVAFAEIGRVEILKFCRDRLGQPTWAGTDYPPHTYSGVTHWREVPGVPLPTERGSPD